MQGSGIVEMLLGSGAVLGVTCVALAGTLGFMAFVLFLSSRLARAMRGPSPDEIPNGESAPAVIGGIKDTGASINDNPQIRIELQVHPKEGAPFRAEISTIVSRLQTSDFQKGAILHVRYNRANPAQIALVGTIGTVEAYAPSGSGAAPAVLPLLHVLLASEALNRTLTAAPEVPGTVVVAEPLGLYCQGRNPLTKLTIAVRLPDRPEYLAEATGAISQLSVERYSTGKPVFVKVDPKDPQRIALARSGD